jgi:hypothetical protein
MKGGKYETINDARSVDYDPLSVVYKFGEWG